jgi:thiosulfate/3-mercaptopyruvate sulfurtransferase
MTLVAGLWLAVGFGWAADGHVIVDTEYVAQAAARGAVLWDVRSEEDYKKGHLPGAVNMDDILTELRDSKMQDYLPIEQLEKKLGRAGIDITKEIVVYGAKANPGAYFGYQTLRYLGAPMATVYHGGFDDWKGAGKQVSTQRASAPSVTVKADPNQALIVSTEQVVARINKPDVQIVDARTPKEYNGDDIRALRGGHIPGAVNIPYEANWVDPDATPKLQRRQVNNKDGMSLKGREALKELYARLDPDKETIVYCQSGGRAAETATVLEELGFKNVKIYDSSWLGYGNTLDAPAVDASYFNVERVNRTFKELQGRIDALEAEVEALKAAAAKKP